MVDPISNQMFSHDFAKFVLQTQDALIMPPVGIPKKPFSIKTHKSNKSIEKEKKSPWSPLKPNQDSTDPS